MKQKRKKIENNGGYTIIELLTIMSIIVILMSLMVPALYKVRVFAKYVTQKNQFHNIENAVELFNAEQDGYPPSRNTDGYCGAMKLAEAMVGYDMLGFNPDSTFRPTDLGTFYPQNPPTANLEKRKMFLPDTDAITRMGSLFNGAPDPCAPVLGDIYRETVQGGKAGMPILYFKANASGTLHDGTDPANPFNVYNLLDNEPILALGPAWEPGESHPIYTDPTLFYEKILNKKITTRPTPYRPKSFILLSAGYDGKYGTEDDVYNFRKD